MSKRRRQNGFSMLELLIAIAILGTLALMMFTMMNSSSGMYSRTSADAHLQSESQIVANSINDSVIDCNEVLDFANGSSYISASYDKPIGAKADVTPDNTDKHILVFKSNNPDGTVSVSRVVRDASQNKLFLITGNVDDTGSEIGIPETHLLADYVEGFEVDTSRFEKERLISYKVIMNKRGVQYTGDYQVYVRNQNVEETQETEDPSIPNLKKVVLNPQRVYIDLKGIRESDGTVREEWELGGKYYRTNPTSDADESFALDVSMPVIGYSAQKSGTIRDEDITYAWSLNKTGGWASISGTTKDAELTLQRDGYRNPDTSYTVTVKATGTYTEDGAEKTVTVGANGSIYLRMCRGVSIKQIVNPNFVKWDPIYEDTPYNGHSSTEAEYYLMPEKTVSFTATPDLLNVLYKTGVKWKLQYKNYTQAGSQWKNCTEARIASLSNASDTYTQRTNTVKLGKDATNDMIFRVIACSEFDDTREASFVFGVIPPGKKNNSIGEYSRGYYTDMSELMAGRPPVSKDGTEGDQKVGDILFFKVTKVDGVGEQDRSGDKVIVKMEDGHVKLMVDFDAFAYSGDQKKDFYGGNVLIHYTIGYISENDGGYVLDGQGWNTYLNEFRGIVGSGATILTPQHDLTYKLKPVVVSKVAPTNQVLVLEKGQSRNITVTTKFYNLRNYDQIKHVYFFGAYLGDKNSRSAMTDNQLVPGHGSSQYFSLNLASALGERDDYVDEGTVTLTAKSGGSYLTDPLTLRLTADDYYRINVGNLPDSFTSYDVILANVQNASVYFPTSYSHSDIAGLKWPDNASSGTEENKVDITGISTGGTTVTGQVYKDDKGHYVLEYGSKKYQLVTSNKYWAPKS